MKYAGEKMQRKEYGGVLKNCWSFRTMLSLLFALLYKDVVIYAPVALKVHRGVVVVSRCCVCVAIAP